MGHDQNPAVGLLVWYRGLTNFVLLESTVNAVAPGVSTPHKNGKRVAQATAQKMRNGIIPYLSEYVKKT